MWRETPRIYRKALVEISCTPRYDDSRCAAAGASAFFLQLMTVAVERCDAQKIEISSSSCCVRLGNNQGDYYHSIAAWSLSLLGHGKALYRSEVLRSLMVISLPHCYCVFSTVAGRGHRNARWRCGGVAWLPCRRIGIRSQYRSPGHHKRGEKAKNRRRRLHGWKAREAICKCRRCTSERQRILWQRSSIEAAPRSLR